MTTTNALGFWNFLTTPSTVTISNYPITLNPPIKQVTILYNGTNPGGSGDYIVTIGTTTYTIRLINNVGTIITPQIPDVDITFPLGFVGTHTIMCTGGPFTIDVPNALTNLVTFKESPQVTDTYLIEMIFACTSPGEDSSGSITAKVTFTRNNNVSVSASPLEEDNDCNGKDCFCSPTCPTTRVPIITISGQSMLDGSDVSDMTFRIFDEFTYYEEECIVSSKNKCQLSRLKCADLQETKFIKCCPWMVSVVRGKGCTLREKLEYLISKNLQPNNIGINEFLYNIIFYGMTRYILSRLLYGKFCIHFLLEKYYERFIRDLGRSRFCRFVEFFEDCSDPNNNFVGYEKFFLYDKKSCKK